MPLAILGKLMHLKLMLMQILFAVGAVQVTVLGGGALLYYYLKHHTICRFEPHVVHSHSHVSDVVPGKYQTGTTLRSLNECATDSSAQDAVEDIFGHLTYDHMNCSCRETTELISAPL